MEKTKKEFLVLDKKAYKMLPPSYKKGAHLTLLYQAIHSRLFFKGKVDAIYNELDAFHFILEHRKDPFDEAFLIGINRALRKCEEGYREDNVHIEIEDHLYFPPSGAKVKKEMEKLFQDYPLIAKKEGKFDDIFAFILKGLLIHPFKDGNGRTFIFALLSLLERIGLKAAPYLPLDALHNGAYFKQTYLYLFHAGGFYYGQKEIKPEKYSAYVKDLLLTSYEWLIQSEEKSFK